jgi:hypothetical protein
MYVYLQPCAHVTQTQVHSNQQSAQYIEHMFATGTPIYTAERTLLTTGALALLFD